MNYNLYQTSDAYFIKETKTGYSFGPYSDKENARKQLRFMNMGGAFDGETPAFIRTKCN